MAPLKFTQFETSMPFGELLATEEWDASNLLFFSWSGESTR